ncbi:YfiR family protein [Dissulfurirhabdus thermomarina]|uniref:YfiR family protein n=1 Tax=Dissulfurirhabdus thermomarina TaxID=1765737 RepID=A0A6N9TMI9_DISTH|nr:YfiR family protein [Dissulfurirhabdus thermomarina]NDY42455.1 YfiR family protein [Dissulfurirhabdus thermomarina]NMX23843.1 YfiR family protein [Dissulfurirhabdus thermomarina]
MNAPPPMPPDRTRTCLALALLLALGCTVATAAPPVLEEPRAKAAFLYNFARFVRWPETHRPEAGGTIRLCVVGADPVGEALGELDGKPIGDRRITVRTGLTPAEAAACHVVFVPRSQEDRLDAVLAALEGRGVLTVSDIPGFARRGGVIGLRKVNRHLRFEIDAAAARRQGLAVSARLLEIARRYAEESEKEE